MLLPRFHRRQEQARDRAQVERVLEEAGPEPSLPPAAGAAGGDRLRARGVPIVGPGVGGTQLGTQPEQAVVGREARRRRRR